MKWLAIARSHLGTREYPGANSNNPTIMRWAAKLGKALGIAYGGDHVPWCGLFVAHCVSEAGLTPAPIAVRASSWEGWGRSCPPTLGAVVTFRRPGGGHVGFLVGQNARCWRVLGGNQSDAVTETWIEKARCTAIRWPSALPISAQSVPWMNLGGAVSRNEA